MNKGGGKKIGILTYYCVPNFGAQLQAISTLGYFQKKGYDPVIIHWYPEDLDEMYRKRVPKGQVNIQFDFFKENMPHTELCKSEDDIINIIDKKNIEAVFIGSDALFKYVPLSKRRRFSKRRLRYVDLSILSVEKLPNPFWGSFIPKLNKKIPVVAFSVSSQNCQYLAVNEKEKEQMEYSLANFDYISVRDSWTSQMVKNFTKREPKITPDPVFSFNDNTYLQNPNKVDLLKKYGLPENYVLLSFGHKILSDKYIKKLKDELGKNNLVAVSFPMPEGATLYKLDYLVDIPLETLDWYYLIKYSKGYIGERMHPIVVALHNTVPFFCFDEYGIKNMKTSSKTYHILDRAGFLDNYCSYKDKGVLPPVDVVQKLILFDMDKAIIFSKEIQKEYENGMDHVLELLNK